MTSLRAAFMEGRNSTSGTDRHYADRAWNNSAAKREADAIEKDRLAAEDEAKACRPDGKPAPVTGPNHGASIPEQFRLLRSLIGTQHPRGLQNIRDIIDYLETVCPQQPDETASDDEIAIASDKWCGPALELDSASAVSRGEDGVWVRAWVLILNDEVPVDG